MTEGVAPESTSWTGHRPGRLIALGFDAANALQLTPVTTDCRRLSWSGGTLQQSVDAEAACATVFAGAVTVETHPTATPPEGRKTYRATLGLGARAQYADGLNGWCARLRVRGRCPTGGAASLSPEVTARATLLLPPAPPTVLQPAMAALPFSTYPDALGNSYYSVDLRDLLSPADRAAGAYVRLYLARLGALTDTPGSFVEGETVIDPPGLRALARQSRGRFALVTDPPEAFDPAHPQVDIRVPGDIDEVYVAAVLGASGLLQAGDWQGAAFLPFRTPPLRALPLLEWQTAAARAEGGAIRATLALAARFPEPLPDPTRLPLLQLFRQSLSDGTGQPRFLRTLAAQSTAPGAERPVVTFQSVDDGLLDWQRYAYAAQLLAYAPGRGQHIKVGGRVSQSLVAPWAGTRDPLEGAALQVAADPQGGFLLDLTLAPGDFDLDVEKRPNSGGRTLASGRIEAGRLFLPTGLTGTLTLGPSVTLRIADPDSAPGLYRARLRFRQALTVSREAHTP